MRTRLASAMLALIVVACTSTPETPKPLETTPPSEAAGAAVVRRPVAPVTPPPPPAAAVTPAPQPFKLAIPPNAIYVCVIQAPSGVQQTAIEFTPKVEKLCRKHPEMGPCQYERNNCRASGGRVFAADSSEITMATEAEYDKKVMRVRFRAN